MYRKVTIWFEVPCVGLFYESGEPLWGICRVIGRNCEMPVKFPGGEKADLELTESFLFRPLNIREYQGRMYLFTGKNIFHQTSSSKEFCKPFSKCESLWEKVRQTSLESAIVITKFNDCFKARQSSPN